MQGTSWTVWAAIAAGSGLGGVARHFLTEAVGRAAGTGFPWGTVLVNASGSVAIGALAGMINTASPSAWSPLARHAMMTGVLGGFTTFSTFSIQTVDLLQQGQFAAATTNVVLSVLLGLAGCWAGFAAVLALSR
jgi:fluoride exporter